jgi:hypothetical protein
MLYFLSSSLNVNDTYNTTETKHTKRPNAKNKKAKKNVKCTQKEARVTVSVVVQVFEQNTSIVFEELE